MIRAKADLTTENCEAKFSLKIGFDVSAGLIYQFGFRGRSFLAGLTTVTRPETRLFGFNRPRKEENLSFARTPRRTRGSAIDPGRANGEYKCSVEAVISR